MFINGRLDVISIFSRYNLTVDKDSLYDENVSSVIFVEFSTAAFRFGHTLVASLIRLYRNLTEERLDKHFFDTETIRRAPKMGDIFFRQFAIKLKNSRYFY